MLVFSLVTQRYKSEQPNALAHHHLYNVNTQIQNTRTKIDLNSAEFQKKNKNNNFYIHSS